MNDFFTNQVDFIFFINGLLLLIVGAGSLFYHKDKGEIEAPDERFEWNWFAAFALCLGINVWMDVFVVGFPS